MTLVQLARWDNGIAFRVPAALLEDLGLSEGGRAEATVEAGKLVVRPAPSARPYALEDLLDAVTDDNRHPATGFEGVTCDACR